MKRAALVVLAACGTAASVPLSDASPTIDAGIVDATAWDAPDFDASHSAPWTISLGTPSVLTDMQRTSSGDMIGAGSIGGALDRDGITLPAPSSGTDPVVFRVASATGTLSWATKLTTYADTAQNSLAYSLAIDGDNVFVTGLTSALSIAFGASVITFPPPATGEHPSRSFVAKLDAVDGHVIWGITFDGARRPYDDAIGGSCLAIVVLGSDIDIGCEYRGAKFGYGGFFLADAAPDGWTMGLIHLVDGSAPAIAWAKSFRSPSNAMHVYSTTRASNGDVFLAGTSSGETIQDMDGDATIYSGGDATGIIGKLDGTTHALTAVAAPTHLVSGSTVFTRIRDFDGVIMLPGDNLVALDTSFNVAWKASLAQEYGSPTLATYGYYVTTRHQVMSFDFGGHQVGGASPFAAIDYAAIIERVELEDVGDMIIGGTYAGDVTFDDGITLVTGWADDKDSYQWGAIFLARRPTF